MWVNILKLGISITGRSETLIIWTVQYFHAVMTNLSKESYVIVPVRSGCHLSISDVLLIPLVAQDDAAGAAALNLPFCCGWGLEAREGMRSCGSPATLRTATSISAVSLTHLGQELGVQCLSRSEFPDWGFSQTVGQLVNSALKMEAVRNVGIYL
jgi:hypothetical protein